MHRKEKPASRVLAIDFGERHLGLAISDELGWTAQPLVSLRRTNIRSDLARVQQIIEQWGVAKIVLGNPLRLDGTAGSLGQQVEQFAERLRQATGLPVELWDERLTSRQAERVLREAGEKDRRRRKLAVDRIAAALLLQNYLDAQRMREDRLP